MNQGRNSHDDFKKQNRVPPTSVVFHSSCNSLTCSQQHTEQSKYEDEIDYKSTERNPQITCPGQCFTKREPLGSWLLLLRAMLYNVLYGYSLSVFTILYVPYTEVFQASKSSVGWIDSIALMANCCIGWFTLFNSSGFFPLISHQGMFLSWPMDRWGNGRVAFTLSLLSSLGFALSALAPNLQMLYFTQGVMAGLGSFLPSVVTVQQHFSYNRVFAGALMIMMMNFGRAIGPYIVELLYEEYGWRGCVLLTSAILAHRMPLGLTFWPPPQEKAKSPTENRKEGGPMTAWQTLVKVLKEAFDIRLLRTNLIFSLFILGCIFQHLSLIAFWSHHASYVVYRGLTLDQAAVIVSIAFFTSMCCEFVLSFVSNMQCMSRPAQYTIGMAMGCLAIVVLLTVPGQTGFVLSSILHGLSTALSFTIQAVLLVDLVGIDQLAKAFGQLGFIVGVTFLGSTPFCGWLYDMTGWYELAFIVIGCVYGLATIMLAIVSVLHGKSAPKLPDIDLDLDDDLENMDSIET